MLFRILWLCVQEGHTCSISQNCLSGSCSWLRYAQTQNIGCIWIRHTVHPMRIFPCSVSFLAFATGKDKNAICIPCWVILRDLIVTSFPSRAESNAIWISSFVTSSSRSLMTMSAMNALTAARSPIALPTASSSSLVLWARVLLSRSSRSPFAVFRTAWTSPLRCWNEGSPLTDLSKSA